MGISIHKLEQLILFKVWGEIPCKGYVDVNLAIPESKAFNEDVLMLVLGDSTYAERIPIQIGPLHIDRAIDLISEG